MANKDYSPKTDASEDRPYNDEASQKRPPAGKDRSTPPDDHTEIDSEADLGDPMDR
ncbi:MAG TPA: hypothetical protein VG839_05440 [Asticcacaulis sp.]|nr:hypothetical protein [Asticcacaulis sp.]